MLYFVEYWNTKDGVDTDHRKWRCGDYFNEAKKVYEKLKETYQHVYLKQRYFEDVTDSHMHCDVHVMSYDAPDDYFVEDESTNNIAFDEKSIYWYNDYDSNQLFLAETERLINEFIHEHGYIYLNQIYEHVGVPWIPNKENILFKEPIAFDLEKPSPTSLHFKVLRR